MLKFSFAVYGLLRKYNKTTFDLAEATRFPESFIYEWRCGRGEMPTPREIIKLARAFAVSPKDLRENHLSLLYAHLWDHLQGPAAEFIDIEVLPKALPIVADAWAIHPTRRRSELDLAAIRNHIWYDAELQKVIRDIAAPLKRKPIPHSYPEKTNQ